MRYKYSETEGEQVSPKDGEGCGVVEPKELEVSQEEIIDYGSRLYEETYNSFYEFMEKIFSVAMKAKYGSWVSGPYIKQICDFLQYNMRTMYLGPRAHVKSVRYYSYIMWKIWRNKKDKKNIRIDYISYNQDLSAAHIGNLKELINKSFFLSEGLYDFDSTATSKAKYAWLDQKTPKEQLPIVEIGSYGILGGLRGGHPDILLVDDLYFDDLKKSSAAVEPDNVKKINNIFRKTVLPMPLFDDEIHIIGTPQSWADIWYADEFVKKSEDEKLKFVVKIQPAYLDFDYKTKKFVEGIKHEALWPEMFPIEGLIEQEQMQGHQSFLQEYCCCPRVSADSFFEQDRIEKSIEYGHEAGLVNYEDFKRFNKEDYFGTRFYAAYDPAKSRNPSQFVVFSYENGELRQVLSKWFDGTDYSYVEEGKPSQFKYIVDAINYFGISKTYCDNTNSVLTTAIERHEIPGIVEMKIGHSMKNKMAIALQKHLGKPDLKLLSDDRQKRALLAIQNDRLKSIESKDNHGESFTTIGFLVANVLEKGLGDEGRRITIKTEKDRLPKMYGGFFFEKSGVQRRDLSFLKNNYGNYRRLM